MNKAGLLVPTITITVMTMMMMMLGMNIPLTSEDTARIASYRKLRKTDDGSLMCALDLANETMSPSSLQDCSLSCTRDVTCSSFNIKNWDTCDLYQYKTRVSTPVTGCTNYQVFKTFLTYSH